ncbi:MAG TPA: hypothetical protein VGN54_07315 [Mycobacteriales bacterium]|nr:hypothetical protein [Mycobacteriales bacterium]
MRRALAATSALTALAVAAAGGYATGHHAGVSAGRNSALAGLDPADVQLIRQLTADRAVALPSPSPSLSAPVIPQQCNRTGAMAKSALCAGLTGAGAPAPAARLPAARPSTDPAAGMATFTAALPAAGAYLAWLRSHPTPNEPLLLTRLIAGKASLPVGTNVSQLFGPGADDADGLVQLAYGGGNACIDVRAVEAAPGQCYDGGNTRDTKGGDYSPKRLSPGYVSSE